MIKFKSITTKLLDVAEPLVPLKWLNCIAPEDGICPAFPTWSIPDVVVHVPELEPIPPDNITRYIRIFKAARS